MKDATTATVSFASSVSTAALDGGSISGAVEGTARAVANLVQSIVTCSARKMQAFSTLASAD